MLENVTAQNGQEERTINENKGLVVAPTSHDIVATNEMLGLETLERDNITIPRIKLAQPVSEEVSNGNASPGEWLNTLSGQNYGTQFEFIPISVWKSRTYFAENRDDSPICRSPDGFVSIDGHRCKTECPHDNAWDWKDGVKPLCAEAYNYLILPVNDQFPAIVTLMRSNHDTGKDLNTMMIIARCPAWFWIYDFYSVRKSSQKGTYYVAGVRKKVEDGKSVPTDEATRGTAETFYQMMKTGRINTAEESEDFSTEPPF